MIDNDMGIRRNDILELHPDCREHHLLFDRLAGSATGVISAGLGLERTAYRIERAAPQRHQLIYTLGGEGWIDLDGERRPARPGSVWISPRACAQRYGLRHGRHWEILWFSLDPATAWPAMAPELRAGRCAAHLHRCVLGLLDEQARPAGGALEAQKALCSLVELYLHRELGPPEVALPPDARLRAGLADLFAQVRDEPALPWDLGLLLRRSGLAVGRDQFGRICRDLLGVTPMQQVARLRLERAAELVQRSDLGLEAIAGMVGYGSPFALSNAFARRYGRRPSTCRAGGPVSGGP